jgi:hypothetical protein
MSVSSSTTCIAASSAVAVPNVRGDYFTIYLNKKVTTSVGPIAWMVTERP